jgi:hypothetical protein
MKKVIISIPVLLLCLSSCSRNVYYPLAGSSQEIRGNPGMVKIYSGDIDQTYTVLGPIAVDVWGDGEDASLYLREKAAAIGADAVIKVSLKKTDHNNGRKGISGIAVGYK